MSFLRHAILLLFLTTGSRSIISMNPSDPLLLDVGHASLPWTLHDDSMLDTTAYGEEHCQAGKRFMKKENESVTSTNQTISCQSYTTHALKNTIQRLNRKLTIGDKLEVNLPSIAITLEKVSSKNLTGKRLVQPTGVQIRFPQLTLNHSTIINLITLPASSVVSLTLHDQYGQVLSIQNTTNPFEILIPRPVKTLMPPVFRQDVSRLSDGSKFKYYRVNLTHHLNLSISLHIEFEADDHDRSYLFIVRLSGVPDMQANLLDDWKLLCPQDRKNGSSKYTYFLSNTRIAHHQWAVVGIREMNECQLDHLDSDNRFSSDYSIRMYASGCYYLDGHNTWQSDGLTVGAESNERFTQCYSTHLSTFASSYIVLPNPVQFNGDFSVERNLTIYITLIVIGLLYLVITGVSYRKDLGDAKMLMVIPLLDNNPRDTYLYQLVVFTGMRANAGTKSKVHFILSGSNDDTNIRTFNAERRIFDRGQTDSFIMAVPRSLGQLNYLRVWHDNSGFSSDASWYLKYILVRDLQTMETNYFICEKWLAVEKDSGEIDRTITVASEFEQRQLKHVLSKNAYRSMADNHLWFSIFAYHLPSANRFTRVQRCTCCFVLFFISLLMNILYYDVKQNLRQEDLDQYGVTIGPFHVSKEEISIGVIVELIIFFPSLLLVTLFRRTKSRHPRTISPVGEAVQTIRANKSTLPSRTNTKGRKFLLPWWFLIIAYLLSFLMVATSVMFILVTSVRIGNEQVQQWLGSILVGFCASVLLTQPLKVLSLALLFMCLCRKKEQVEAFIEQEDPVEDFTVSTTDAHRKFPPQSILAKTRLDPYRARREKEALIKQRALRMKELKADFILRELVLLLVFLGTLYAISYANRDVENAHRMVKYLEREFARPDYHFRNNSYWEERNTTYTVTKIRSIADYWTWLDEVFAVTYLRIARTDASNAKRSVVPYTQTSQMIGWPVLRQLRVKNESCPRKVLHGRMEVNDCNLAYTWYNEAKTPFGYNVDSITWDHFKNPFKYRESEDKTLVYSATDATYMAGGYVHEILGKTTAQVRKGFDNLRTHHWIDQYTRAVFLTFGLYNPDANLFVYCSFLLEQLPVTGTISFRPTFQPLKLVQLYTGAQLVYCLVYLGLVIYYMAAEIKLFLETRRQYVKQFWSYINWAIIVCSWFGVVIHAYRQREVKKMTQTLATTKGRQPIDLQLLSYLDNVLTYLLGFCCFFGTVKLLCVLRVNHRMSLLQLTLQKSARQMAGFFLMFPIVFVAFVSLFYLLFHPYLEPYSSWLASALACLQKMAMHFSTVSELRRADPFIAGLCLFLFLFLAVFLLSNMLISIIVDNFNTVRQEELKRDNEVELIQFAMRKVKQFLGVNTYVKDMDKNKNPVAEFPEKIDRLMIAVNKMYNDQRR